MHAIIEVVIHFLLIRSCRLKNLLNSFQQTLKVNVLHLRALSMYNTVYSVEEEEFCAGWKRKNS